MVNNYISMIQAFQRFVVNKLMLKVFVSVSTCWLTLLWLQYIVQQLPAVLLSKDQMQTQSVKVTQVFAVCLVIFYTCVFLFIFLASKVSQSNSVLWKNLQDVHVSKFFSTLDLDLTDCILILKLWIKELQNVTEFNF